jgi:hypothetical protein
VAYVWETGAENPEIKKPDGSQDHSQIVTGPAKHGMESITQTSFEPVSPQSAFIFHVTYRRFYGTASVDGFSDGRCDATLLITTPDCYAFHADVAIAFVNKDCFGFLSSETFDLLNGFRQGVSVIGIARQAALPTTKPCATCDRCRPMSRPTRVRRDFRMAFMRRYRLAWAWRPT